MKKKIFRKISKKITGIIFAMTMLFSNFVPFMTVFALTEDEKEDMVELRMRGASGIDIDNGQATIHYDWGDVTVSGADLNHVEDNNWDYGSHVGVMHMLYTSSTSLTFHFYPEGDGGVTYRIGGDNPEQVQNNEWTVSNLVLRNQRPEGYDIEFECGGGGPNLPMPSGAIYDINFGTASWNVNETNVTASIQGKDLTDGFLEIVDSDTIQLTNFNPDTMEVVVRTSAEFRVSLFVDQDMTTCLAWIQGGVLPQENLYFSVEPKQNNNVEGVYEVEFDGGVWNVDGDEVVASIEGQNIALDNGPIELDAHTAIHLEGFNPETMEARIVVPYENNNDFSTTLFVDEQNNTSLDAVGQNTHIPNDGVVFFSVVRRGGDNEPHNQPQEGNTTAIIRVNGVEGSFTEWGTNPDTGEPEEYEVPYDGRNSSSNETKFNINGGHVWSLLPGGETEDDMGWYQYNEIEYQYDEEEGDTTVTIGLFTEWHRKFSGTIRINDIEYQVSDFIDYENKGDWFSHLCEEEPAYVGFYITVPKAEDNIYAITVQVDPNDIVYISEFIWSNDPERSYVYGPDDQILLDENDNPLVNSEFLSHVALEIIGAQISVGDQSFSYDENDFNNSFSDDFIEFQIDNHNEYRGGRLLVPSDTVLTARIVPEPGYQIENVISEGDFIATDEPLIYTFDIPAHRSDFNIIANEEENEITLYDDYFENAYINIDDDAEAINGNYILSIDSTELSQADYSALQEYASGYNIEHCFNMEMYQVISNVTLENEQYDHSEWYIPITTLKKKSGFAFELENSLDDKEYVVIHSNGDGTFETLDTDVEDNIFGFETKKLGDFILVSRTLIDIEEVDVMVTPPTPGVKVDVTTEHDPETNEDYSVASIIPATQVPTGAHYHVEDAAWLNGTCNGGANLCNEYFNGTFDINGVYYAGIAIVPEDGYKFTNDTLDHLTINGNELETGTKDQILYAESNLIAVIVQISPDQTPPVMKGDMNNNGKIDLADIILLLRKYIADSATPEEVEIGDMDENGVLTLADIIALLREYLTN